MALVGFFVNALNLNFINKLNNFNQLKDEVS